MKRSKRTKKNEKREEGRAGMKTAIACCLLCLRTALEALEARAVSVGTVLPLLDAVFCYLNRLIRGDIRNIGGISIPDLRDFVENVTDKLEKNAMNLIDSGKLEEMIEFLRRQEERIYGQSTISHSQKDSSWAKDEKDENDYGVEAKNESRT